MNTLPSDILVVTLCQTKKKLKIKFKIFILYNNCYEPILVASETTYKNVLLSVCEYNEWKETSWQCSS